MTTEIRFELQRIVRRRGPYLGCTGFAAALAMLGVVVGGEQNENLWSSLLGVGLVMAGTIVGALAGSYDLSQGTMRYLVLTGTPRPRLVAVRVPALMLALAALSVPALLIGWLAMATGHHADGSTIVRVLLGSELMMLAWGLVSLAVGTLLRSNGAGIAASLVLFLVGFPITEFVRTKISRTIGDHFVTNAANVISSLGHTPPGGEPFTIGLGAAAVTMLVWLAALLGLAVARVQRDEY